MTMKTPIHTSQLLIFLLSLFPHNTPQLAFGTTTYVSSKYKAPTSDTHPSLAQKWQTEDEKLWSYITSHVPDVLEHTGGAAFDEHLKGVQAILRYWGAPDHLCSAGLFHSIYGTEGFQGFSLPLSERDTIRGLIGEKAERLCWIFCMVDRATVDDSVFSWEESDVERKDKRYVFKSRPELGRFEMELSKEEWLDFIELLLVDWLEQVEGAAETPLERFLWKRGEAYSHRRHAYRQMAELLSVERSPRLKTIAPEMYEDVMATEPEETRQLVQPRTPPMSEAAANAMEALRSAGEMIPEDLSPQPMADVKYHACVKAYQ